LENVPIDKVEEFEKLFLQLVKAKYQKEVLDPLKAGKLTDDVQAKLRECAAEISARYMTKA
ncbi:MAG: F0F1 ATP synthase subunit alpha, partial [Muribaculaceae bacterium]|nr:F0F1 ATP synthase subunit alpha [Muribaculaceae bacterium]